MEELLLGGLLAGDELNVVHQQQVGLAVLLAEFLRAAGPDGGDDLVGELLTVHIDDIEIRMVLADLDLNGVQQVGFAQARVAVDEQGVGRHSLGCRIGELVGGAADKVLKGELIPAAGQGGHLVRVVGGGDGQAGHHQLQVDLKPQHALEGVLQKRNVTVPHDLADELVAHAEHHMVGVFKAHRLQTVNVQIVGGVHQIVFAVQLDRVQNVVE